MMIVAVVILLWSRYIYGHITPLFWKPYIKLPYTYLNWQLSDYNSSKDLIVFLAVENNSFFY